MDCIKKFFGTRDRDSMILVAHDGLEIVRDYDIYNIPINSFGLYTFDYIPKMGDIFNQIYKYHSPGLRSLNYWLSHPSLIPDIFKERENLCMGIILKDGLNRLHVPCFFYLKYHEKWHSSFFCLSTEKIIPGIHGILILKDIQEINK